MKQDVVLITGAEVDSPSAPCAMSFISGISGCVTELCGVQVLQLLPEFSEGGEAKTESLAYLLMACGAWSCICILESVMLECSLKYPDLLQSCRCNPSSESLITAAGFNDDSFATGWPQAVSLI